jgi:hypothetical protein
MLGYRKKSFRRAHGMLSTLRADLEDLDTLKSLQQLLLGEIARAERKIRLLKSELKSIAHSGGAKAAKRSSVLNARINRVRQCAYVWRCFGDAVAFTYMDKFALKQVYYSVDKPSAKQDAGFISDKSGLANEIAMLHLALQNNVPALLADLTNTIRHGDVCLMGAFDPYLIEVKTSKKLNSRGKRQKKNLEKLHSFLESDQAKGLRGLADVRRQALEIPERTYTAELNACIADAIKNGYATRSPERGLFYVIMTTERSHVQDAFQSVSIREPWTFDLNDFKNERAWAHYLPFTVSIEGRDHLWAFIRGEIYILVLVELDTLRQIAVENGCAARIDRDSADGLLHITVPGVDFNASISSQFLGRIGMEFISPEWAVLASIDMIKRSAQEREEISMALRPE